MFKSIPQTRKFLLVSSNSYCATIRNISRCSDETLIHRHTQEHIKMQITSYQYFPEGCGIREDLPKINVKNQFLLLVTSNSLTLLTSKTSAK